MKLTFNYQLSPKFLNQAFLETGEKPCSRSVIEIDSVDLTQEERASYINLASTRRDHLGEIDHIPTIDDVKSHLRRRIQEYDDVVNSISKEIDRLAQISLEEIEPGFKAPLKNLVRQLQQYKTGDTSIWEVYFNEAEPQMYAKANAAISRIEQHFIQRTDSLLTQFEESLLDVPTDWIEKINEAMGPLGTNTLWEIERCLEAVDCKIASRFQALKRAISAKAKAEKAEAKAKAEAEQAEAKAKAEAEKAQWIEAHGDERLKLAYQNGYECQRLYVEQRAGLEFPGWAVDFGGNAKWEDRVSPTLEALLILERMKPHKDKAEIVWITCPHHEWDEYDEDSGEEAIVIRAFLGRYNLIQYLGDPLAS